jgi:tetratricopeptide (TPR) repeat protein
VSAVPKRSESMSTRRPTLGLAMIVKNEVHVLERCLTSVRPYLDHWTIVDTGSTDGTQELARRVLADVPGEVHERPWKNFGHNRTESLQLAAPHSDYIMVIDADDELQPQPGFRLPRLTADAYLLRIIYGNTEYYRIQIMRSALDWRYEGVLHEYPACDKPDPTTDTLHGLAYRIHSEGASWRDPEKYRKDALLLEEALRIEPENARYAFYLAQSWRDAGDPARALECYEQRAAMGGWDEEVFVSLLEAAKLRESLQAPYGDVVAAYLRAHEARPRRAESLTHLARYCRGRENFASAFLFAAAAVQTPRPGDLLFVEDATYAWRALDEYAIAAYWVGRHREAIDANRRLLSGGKLPPDQVDRVKANLQFSVDKIPAAVGRTHR